MDSDKSKQRPQTARPVLRSSTGTIFKQATAHSSTHLENIAPSQRRINFDVNRQVVSMWYQSQGLPQTTYDSLSGKDLATGNSPQYWLDPETNVYRLVPSYRAVGKHPMVLHEAMD
eukprot:764923-Hanusia_phi.AAC.11